MCNFHIGSEMNLFNSYTLMVNSSVMINIMLYAPYNVIFTGDNEIQQRYIFHLFHLCLNYTVQHLLEMTSPTKEIFFIVFDILDYSFRCDVQFIFWR